MTHNKTAIFAVFALFLFSSKLSQIVFCPGLPEQKCSLDVEIDGLVATAPGFVIRAIKRYHEIVFLGNFDNIINPNKLFHFERAMGTVSNFYEIWVVNANTSNAVVQSYFNSTSFEFTTLLASSNYIALLAANRKALFWNAKNITVVVGAAQIALSSTNIYYLTVDGKVFSSSTLLSFELISIADTVVRLSANSYSLLTIAVSAAKIFAIDMTGVIKEIDLPASHFVTSNSIIHALNNSGLAEYNITNAELNIQTLPWKVVGIEDVNSMCLYRDKPTFCTLYGVFQGNRYQLKHMLAGECISCTSAPNRICMQTNGSFRCVGDFSDLHNSLDITLSSASMILIYVSFSIFQAVAVILLCANLICFKSMLHWFQQFHILFAVGASICHLVTIEAILVKQWKNIPAVPIGFVLLAMSFIALAIIFVVILIRSFANRESCPHCVFTLLFACALLQAVVLVFLIAGFLELFSLPADSYFLWVTLFNVPFLFELVCAEIAVHLDWKQNKVREQKHKDKLLLELAFQKNNSEVELKVLNMDLNIMTIPFNELSNLEEIGSGASGMVIKAKWRNQLVAVKLFRYADDSMIEMFNKELQLLIFLRHENIVNMYGVCNEHPRYALIMEYCSNQSLMHLIRSKQLKQMHVQLISDVAHGMNYLHNRDVLHRDLKPDNVLITDKWVAKIADFGTSKIGSSSQAMTTRIGTSWYMAPEVVQGQEYNEKCDVFSFGILMYQVVFEVVNPYGTNNEVEYMVAKNPTYRPTIPESLLWWQIPLVAMIKKCWDHNSMARPTFEEICFELQNIQ